MELRTLRYFVTVAEEGNIGRAAHRLHMAQPPLTRQISGLEAELGARLFTRVPRGVILTQAGEILLRDAVSLLDLAAQAAERTRRAGRGEVGVLDVGIYGSAVLDVVPRLLSVFSSTHPDVEIVLHHAPKAEQIEALRQGRILVAFDRNLPTEDDLVLETVAREALLVALPSRHRLARRHGLAMTQLRDERFIGGVGGDAGATRSLFEAAGFTPRVVQEVGDMMTAAALVASGMGIALMPESMRNLRLPGLVFKELLPRSAFIEVTCFYRRGNTSPLLQAFLETIRSSTFSS